jgi:hypothetical protein
MQVLMKTKAIYTNELHDHCSSETHFSADARASCV